jgi:protein-tyrosine phosphatase
MPSTAEDFWRMVTEHSVSTMVMLSGDKAWKYWREGGEGGEREGDAISFGSLKVTLISKEKLTSYVKREFKVLNTKVAEEIGLTHFEYSSWTGDAAEDVPSSTHGILDLVEHATAHRTEAGLTGPIAVHCR